MSMTTTRILIVEDERIIAADLRRHVTRLGYEVVDMVGSGAAAIEHAQTLHPDLVLMDIGLPGGMNLSGVGFLKKVVIMPILLPSCMSLLLVLPAASSGLGQRQHRQGWGLLLRHWDRRPGCGHEAAHGQRGL